MICSVELSLLARGDIRHILAYTQLRYGKPQREEYRDLIFKTLEAIAENPDLGHSRCDMPPIYRALGVKAHVIIYRRKEKTIFVARILYKQADFSARL